MINRLAIDLGTSSVKIYVPDKGVVIDEPNVVAIDTLSEKVMAVGKEAKKMIGRTPESIIASAPLKNGVVANFANTQHMVRIYINQLIGKVRLIKPEIMVCVPVGITSTERRAVVDAVMKAGARNVYVIKSPIAAALGSGIDISSTAGNMVIDVGGGTTEVAVIALGDVVASSSMRMGGDRFDEAIANYLRKKFNIVIGEQTAEEIKIKIGFALDSKKKLQVEVSGSNAISGLPESVMVSSNDVTAAIKPVINEILQLVKQVLQKTPPELASDVMDKGIIISGGGAKLRRFDELLTKVTGVPCQMAEEPEFAVIRGAGIAVENLEEFKQSILWRQK